MLLSWSDFDLWIFILIPSVKELLNYDRSGKLVSRHKKNPQFINLTHVCRYTIATRQLKIYKKKLSCSSLCVSWHSFSVFNDASLYLIVTFEEHSVQAFSCRKKNWSDKSTSIYGNYNSAEYFRLIHNQNCIRHK